jgi:hypothetical protein
MMSEPVILTMTSESELMNFAFGQVRNGTDWRAPVDAYVPWGQANVYMQAIEFITLTKPTCERVERLEGSPTPPGGWAHLTSIGYRAGPAGP